MTTPAPLRIILGLCLCLARVSLAEPVRIITFGDSVVAPRADTRVYAEILQEELANVEIRNAGVQGNTTTAGLKRLDADVRAHKPHLVTIHFGINDSAVDVWKKPPATGPRVALETYQANLKEMIAKLRADGTRVVLVSPTPLLWTPKLVELYGKPPYDPSQPDGFDKQLQPYREVLQQVASAEKVPLLDANAAIRSEAQHLQKKLERFIPDGMHPEDLGHRVMADLLREGILQLAKAEQLNIAPGRVWKLSGSNVRMYPEASDTTHNTPNPTVLGCSIVRLEDGQILTAYSTPGTAYGKHGTNWIALRSTSDQGASWSDERSIAWHADSQAANPSLLRARDGTIHAFYIGFKKWAWKGENPTADTASDLWTVRSTDNGKTWSEPQCIFQGYTGATNGAVETRAGILMVPFSHYALNPGRLVSRVVYSSDKGASWSTGAPLDIGGSGDHGGALEPALIERKDGSVRMYIRTTLGSFYECDTTDGGANWSVPKPGKVEATSAPAHLCRLADGRIAIAWNPRIKGRRTLHIAFSSDEGETWSPSIMIAYGLSATYPFLLETVPGELWVGLHDIAKDWNTPRARLMRLPLASLSSPK